MSAGHLVLVVGPSGAGKDSVLRGAARVLVSDRRFVFPRRVVTRPADAAAEDHDSLTGGEFRLRQAAGGFALWWEAHGHCYGIGAGIVADLHAGRVVCVNVSRGIIASAAARFDAATVVEISAPADILANRIAARGREAADALASRLARPAPPYPPGIAIERIVNAGTLDHAVTAFCELLNRVADRDVPSGLVP